MLAKLFHVVLILAALYCTGSLIFRYYQIKSRLNQNLFHLKYWIIALVAILVVLSFYLVWDFNPGNANIYYTRSISSWLIVFSLLVLIYSMIIPLRKIKIFWQLYILAFLLSMIFLFYSLFYFISRESGSMVVLRQDLIFPFGVVAPLELFIAFLSLFWGALCIGEYFNRKRMAGFMMIASAMLGLGSMNLTRPWLEKTVAYWEAGYFIQHGQIISVWEFSRLAFIFILFIGFYLATLPKKNHARGGQGNSLALNHDNAG